MQQLLKSFIWPLWFLVISTHTYQYTVTPVYLHMPYLQTLRYKPSLRYDFSRDDCCQWVLFKEFYAIMTECLVNAALLRVSYLVFYFHILLSYSFTVVCFSFFFMHIYIHLIYSILETISSICLEHQGCLQFVAMHANFETRSSKNIVFLSLKYYVCVLIIQKPHSKNTHIYTYLCKEQ